MASSSEFQPAGSSAVVEFGPFELDRGAGELRKQGTRIRLQPKPMQILRVMSRNTISDRNSDICFAYQYHSSSRSSGSSQRSTNIEWKRYSNQRWNMSKSRLTGQEDGTRYHPSS